MHEEVVLILTNNMTTQCKSCARSLSDSDVDTIVKMLDGWVGELTWYTLIDAIKVWQQTSIDYTRQALHHHERIYSGYLRNKKRLSEAEKVNKDEMRQWLRKLMRTETSAWLEADYSRLKAQNEYFLRQFDNSKAA